MLYWVPLIWSVSTIKQSEHTERVPWDILWHIIYTHQTTPQIKIINTSFTSKDSSWQLKIVPYSPWLPSLDNYWFLFFLSLWISLHFLEFDSNRIMHNVLFFVWPLSSRIKSSFHFIVESYHILCIYEKSSTCSLVDGHLGYFQFGGMTS